MQTACALCRQTEEHLRLIESPAPVESQDRRNQIVLWSWVAGAVLLALLLTSAVRGANDTLRASRELAALSPQETAATAGWTTPSAQTGGTGDSLRY
jgi:hypothetical protein